MPSYFSAGGSSRSGVERPEDSGPLSEIFAFLLAFRTIYGMGPPMKRNHNLRSVPGRPSMTRVAASGLSLAMKDQMSQSSPSTHGARMNLPTRPRLCDPPAQPSKNFLAIDALPAFQRLDAFEQLIFEFFPRSRRSGQALLLIFFEPAQSRANDLARGLVKTAADFLLHEAFQFGCE